MIYNRLLRLPNDHSFLVFGARGTGKSTSLEEWSRQLESNGHTVRRLDLLDPETEETYRLNAGRLKEELETSTQKNHWIVID